MSASRCLLACLVLSPWGTGCQVLGGGDLGQSHFEGLHSTLYDFDFDGSLVASVGSDEASDPVLAINSQLAYAIGQLTYHDAAPELGRLVLTNVVSTATDPGQLSITYHATLPISIKDRIEALPADLELVLPRDVSSQALDFMAYADRCGFDAAARLEVGESYGRDAYFYFYNPDLASCPTTDPAFAHFATTRQLSPLNSSGKYPEYDRVWQDGKLNVVALFGRLQDGDLPDDFGYKVYDAYVRSILDELAARGVTPTTSPAILPAALDRDTPRVELDADLDATHHLHLTAFMLQTKFLDGDPAEPQYEARTGDADLIVWGGHGGLGRNVRRLGQLGTWTTGQYTLFFVDACRSFAYATDLVARRGAVNPDDPTGSRYADMIVNGLPESAGSIVGPEAATTIALMTYSNPLSYQQLFAQSFGDTIGDPVVIGDEDNTYSP